ncbi:branched-chain amino acid ABC transporter permease [Rarobacter incanus]|uniref:Amino acid/amide ABC transporter membrane protein 1 (HAAT family) n=1 Tax=Rarobacter incanus TaxID=153494 RepID=A0A542SQD2_9MICO|nr:branched-chain amino acid ABC transporter permease [Rarobacter incanus]TQK76821.1 amino acid/amide ABC transporter membrane protein 1 (HAAT family) [Rarobacter incanus]
MAILRTMPERTYRPFRPHRLRAIAMLFALIGAVWMMLPSVANADVTASEKCTKDATTGCVMVNVFGKDREPVGGVKITLKAPDGASATATSTDKGATSFEATTADAYSVSLDPASLPDEFADAAPADVTVTVQFGATARATFDLTAPAATAPAATSGSTPTAGSNTTKAATSTDSAGTGLSADRVWQQLASGLRFGLMLALASLGANLIYGTTKLSNFAHGEQVTLGAVIAYLFVSIGAPLWLAAILSVAISAATGWLQDVGIWKPLRKRGTPITQVMIVTIGLSIALQFLIQFMVGTGTFQVVSGNPTTWTVGPITMTKISFIAMLISIVALVAVAWFLTRTRLGRATRAVSDNPALASATGINTNGVIRLVWTLSAGLAGLSGLLFALMFGAANWNMGMQMLLLMFAAITLGGLGTANGALVGSLVIGFAVELSSLFLPSDLRYATALFILILALLVRPQGILGLRDRIG